MLKIISRHIAHVTHRTLSVWLETGGKLSLPQIDHCTNPHITPHQHLSTRKGCSFYIPAPLNNPVTLPDCDREKHVWPQSSWMTSLPHVCPQGLILKSVCVCVILSIQWVALSLWEPTADWSHYGMALSDLLCRSGCGVTLLWPSWPPWVFIPTVAFVTFTAGACFKH